MMSALQKHQIEEMRRQGIGYGMIAKKMKMNKSTISAYCNRNGLAGVGRRPLFTRPKEKEGPQRTGISSAPLK